MATYIYLRKDDVRELGKLVPDYMLEGLVLYIERGVRPGDFMYHILANDFATAAMHADDVNRTRMYQWAIALYHYVPSPCWGSYAKVGEWMAKFQVDANAN